MRTLSGALLALLLAVPIAALGENEDDVAFPTMVRSGGIVLFYKSTGPMQFVAMTPRDLPKDARQLGEVKGVSCQRGLSVPLAANIRATSLGAAYGDGGYQTALAEIQKKHPELVGVYDVRVDIGVFSILGGLYRSLCTEVTARGFALPKGVTVPVGG